MIGLLAATLAGVGAYLLFTAVVFRWRGFGGAVGKRRRAPRTLRAWLDEAGLADVGSTEFAGSCALLAVVGGALAYALFGGILPALLSAGCCSTLPLAAYRSRRARRRAVAQEAWPRLLEELRLLTGSLGRSIPQALFEVGGRAPDELRPAFAAAEREWLLTTDFTTTAAVLRQRLADPTADVVAETLVVAHDVGGGDLDRRLGDLIEDRTIDVEGRKDAATKQAGVRFARGFVLAVPLGMAVAGLSIGSGRSAYESFDGQLGVALGIVAVAGCWIWSGRLLRIPSEPRVFAEAKGDQR